MVKKGLREWLWVEWWLILPIIGSLSLVGVQLIFNESTVLPIQLCLLMLCVVAVVGSCNIKTK